MLNWQEAYRTDKFEYLLIHKNGCQSVCRTIHRNGNYAVNPYVQGGLPLFVVVRDPWERTISGLAYDLERTYGDISEEILDEIDWERMFYQPVHKHQKATTYISHSSVQIGYLFDINPNFYVDLKNLTPFLKIHFKHQIPEDMKNVGNKEFKEKLTKLLDSRKDLQDTIRKYLAVDYYFMERIRNTEILWDFPMGKMW